MFSFRAQEAPREQARAQQQSSHADFSISDLLRVALECGIVEADSVKIGGVPVGSRAPDESEGEAA